jgi:adenosylmethionine---8-amino-7-oxononanoate aminotransferase
MHSISHRDKQHIWHPYTPMKLWPEAIAITRGEGVFLTDENGNQYIDAISSWWVNLHGHAHPYIAQKVSEQLHTLEHSIFAGFTHLPAVLLAERLLPLLPGKQEKIFYSDNGSTAVEVALKIAVQYWSNIDVPKKRIVALENAYHGDTVGAMSVSGRSPFNSNFTSWLFDVDFIPFPSVGNAEKSIAVLEYLLQSGDIAALIVEPLIQGSAGMYTYSAEVLDAYFKLCKKYNTLIIADEVMTGFGRTGKLFACEHIDTTPDIICLSKGITGGSMPFGATTTTQKIFDAFYDDDKQKMLYHGHSYTGNPLACTAALASLDLLLSPDCIHSIQRISSSHSSFVKKVQDKQQIRDIRQLGTILALELNTSDDTSYNNSLRDGIYQYFIERKILIRPLGNIIYILPPYCIQNEELEYIYENIISLLDSPLFK